MDEERFLLLLLFRGFMLSKTVKHYILQIIPKKIEKCLELGPKANLVHSTENPFINHTGSQSGVLASSRVNCDFSLRYSVLHPKTLT